MQSLDLTDHKIIKRELKIFKNSLIDLRIRRDRKNRGRKRKRNNKKSIKILERNQSKELEEKLRMGRIKRTFWR